MSISGTFILRALTSQGVRVLVSSCHQEHVPRASPPGGGFPLSLSSLRVQRRAGNGDSLRAEVIRPGGRTFGLWAPWTKLDQFENRPANQPVGKPGRTFAPQAFARGI